MQTVTSIVQLEEWLGSHFTPGKSLGFVPTMGALHEGHLSLIRRSVSENDFTACSIFVNPIQFNNPTDLERYPRMPEKDLAMLSTTGCSVVFMPGVAEIYPEPVEKIYDFGLLDKVMEGAFRPGHFNGVAIVVNRLFQLVRPTRAYFGLKDYQQLMIIREMTRQEGHPVIIAGCPIIREPDGLAMSSRNLRLTPEQRHHAPVIYQGLLAAKALCNSLSVKELTDRLREMYTSLPGCIPEYITFANAETLQSVQQWKDTPHCILCVAVFFGDIRLIDNLLLY